MLENKKIGITFASLFVESGLIWQAPDSKDNLQGMKNIMTSITGIVAAKTAKVLATLVLMVLGFVFFNAQAQERTIRVTFPFDSPVLSSDYMQNASSFAVIDSLERAGAFEGATLEVVSYSSPEGNYDYNLALSRKRANALRRYLVGKYPVLDGKVSINPDSESWGDLRRAVVSDDRLSDESRTRILDIIDSSAAPDSKEASLKALPEYKSLYRNFFRAIRYAEIVVRTADSRGDAGQDAENANPGETTEQSVSSNSGSAVSSVQPSFAGLAPTSVTFPLRETDVREDYMLNRSALAQIDSLITYGILETLVITGAASPEGPEALNRSLALGRAQALRDWIVTKYPELEGKVSIRSAGENWNDLRKAVLADTIIDAPARARVLAIIDSNDTPAGKESRLKKMNEYQQIFDRFFPALRASKLETSFKASPAVPVITVPEISDVSISITEDETGFNNVTNDLPSVPALSLPPVYEVVKAPLFAASTNLLYDAAITPNFSLELPIGQRFSIFADYTFPWWVNRKNDRAWEILKWDIGARFWMSRRDRNNPMDVLKGHFIGIDFGAGYYDIEPKHTGYQGEFQTLGLEYGYAWRLGEHWRLDAFIGAGWMGTHYRYYEGSEDDQHLLYQYNGKLQWFGPTKVGVSIKYIFTHNVRRRVK